MTYTFETLPIQNKEMLREGILQLFDRDIATVPCAFSSRNYVFIFGEGCFPAVIRVGMESPHRTAEDILSELMWVDDLKNDIKNVCQPLPSLKNRMVERVIAGDATYLVTMFRKANGAVLSVRHWTPEHLYNMGALLGKIHCTSYEGYQRGFRYKRKHWDQSPYFDFSCYDGYFTPTARQDAEAVLSKIQSIPRDPRWYGMIHGDYHPGNLFCDWGELWAFDFDDSCYGYFMFDIACLAYICTHAPSYAQAHPSANSHEHVYGKNGILTLIRAGYSSEYSLPDEHWELFEDFFRLRVAQTFSIQVIHQTSSKELILALNEPKVEYFKCDCSPFDKMEEAWRETWRRIPPEALDTMRKLVAV